MAERKPFLLRMSPELWGELETWAQDEFRSVNAQIEYLLREAVVKRRCRRAETDTTADTAAVPTAPLKSKP